MGVADLGNGGDVLGRPRVDDGDRTTGGVDARPVGEAVRFDLLLVEADEVRTECGLNLSGGLGSKSARTQLASIGKQMFLTAIMPFLSAYLTGGTTPSSELVGEWETRPTARPAPNSASPPSTNGVADARRVASPRPGGVAKDLLNRELGSGRVARGRRAIL
jgi:hypothetical protein